MKKIIALVLSVSIIFSSTILTEAAPKYRTATGKYYNYMCIVTRDGNEWLLSDSQSSKNPYMKWDKKSKCYKPIFKNGQKVIVKFDTKGTKSKLDDEIISVRRAK